MKKMKAVLALAACILCLGAAALSEPARVETPGGPVNMRKKDSAKSTVVAEVPNHAPVEAVEIGDTWSKITYKNKTGYVKTEFLLLSSALTGKTVYPDGGSAMAYTAPSADAAVLHPFNGDDVIRVSDVEDGWAVIDWTGRAGYVPLESLLAQRAEPSGALDWIMAYGVVAQDCVMTLTAAETTPLAAGEAVTVTKIEGDRCLALVGSRCGWVPVSAVRLDGPGEDGEADLPQEGIGPQAAQEKAAAALKKQFKGFSGQRLYCLVDGYGTAGYLCAFYNEEDRQLYRAALDSRGKTIRCADYTAFAAPDPDADLLPDGEMEVTLSADTLAVGEVLDIVTSAWTRSGVQYSLSGPVNVQTAPGAHFTASWRPQTAGEYTLTVTVTDENGLRQSRQRQITVTPSGMAAPEAVYSQKDGWWLDKPYRNSTLDKSGCAIFTLSHALARMGHTGDSLLPENLAKTFSLCLTPDGTNNERLIREAAAAFGFKTQGALITDMKQLKKMFGQGDMFSFSIARGHIALAVGLSEDGSMVRVVDSAPFATFERIVNDSLYYQTRGGGFRAATRMEDIPGARWYLDTDDYGGLEYWLRLSYVARRGARLIRP